MPKSLQPYFWDVDVSSLDISEKKNFVISRLLEKGRVECMQWVFQNYSYNDIQKAVSVGLEMSSKTKRLVQSLLS